MPTTLRDTHSGAKEENMNDAASEVREIVDRETRAWDTKDAELLLSVFHLDMVWPWPKSPLLPRPYRVGPRVGPLRS